MAAKRHGEHRSGWQQQWRGINGSVSENTPASRRNKMT